MLAINIYFAFVADRIPRFANYPAPPPNNPMISSTSSNALTVSYSSPPIRSRNVAVCVLYRQYSSNENFLFLQSNNSRQLVIEKLTSSVVYELKVATLDGVASIPGPFLTLTQRTLGKEHFYRPASD